MVKVTVFSSSQAGMWKLDHKKGWAPKNWCFPVVVLQKTLESAKEIPSIHPKGNQPWIFIERTDAESEASIFWSPDVKSDLIWKDPEAGKDWREKKRAAEDEMVKWHHRVNGLEFEQTLWD